MGNRNAERERLFHAAVELTDPAERARFLDAACGGDAELRDAIESLLRHDEATGDFLSDPLQATLQVAGPMRVAEVQSPGTRIGPYKLLEPIGEGGMGTVYMAEQVEPVRRRVALKLIKPGMDTKQVIARFEAERQALALMDHPNIARVLDAGTTDNGRPYFVMELVKGIADHRVLRPGPALDPRAPGAVPPGLPGRAARPPEGDHPPRPQALERPGHAARRRARAQGHRLRRRQGDRASASPTRRCSPASRSSWARRST